MMGKAMLLILSLTAVTLFPGCEKKGAMEKAGESIDKSIDKTEQNIEDAGKDIKKSINK